VIVMDEDDVLQFSKQAVIKLKNLMTATVSVPRPDIQGSFFSDMVSSWSKS
jgi:hypothetical protein